MTGGILGGGILLGVLVLLWVVVLAPGWAKGREFRAAEQNAARLQRTLRVLVETAAVPEEHIVEATARQALAHEKLVKATEEHREALRKVKLRQLLTEQKRELRLQRALARRARLANPRLKPVRVVAALLTVMGLIGVLVGLGLAIAGVGWLTTLASLSTVIVSMTTLIVLAPKRAVQTPRPQVERPAVPAQTVPEPRQEEPVVETSDSRRSAEAYAKAQAEAARERELARAKARARARNLPESPAARVNQTDLILLKSQQPTLNVAERRRQLTMQERLRAMGVVGDTAEGMPDLDETLKRRRNAS